MYCEICGKEIARQGNTGRKPRWCEEHRARGHTMTTTERNRRRREAKKRADCQQAALVVVGMVHDGKTVDEVANFLYNTFKKKKEKQG